jgi:hypothetical protein
MKDVEKSIRISGHVATCRACYTGRLDLKRGGSVVSEGLLPLTANAVALACEIERPV